MTKSKMTNITFFSPGNTIGAETLNLGSNLIRERFIPDVILTGQNGLQIAAAETIELLIKRGTGRCPDIRALGPLTGLPAQSRDGEEDGLRQMICLIEAVKRDQDGTNSLVIGDPLLLRLYEKHVLNLQSELPSLGLPQAFQTTFDAAGEITTCKNLPVLETTVSKGKEFIY